MLEIQSLAQRPLAEGGIIIIAVVNPVSRSLRSQQTLVVRPARSNSLLGPIINSVPRSVTISDAAKVEGGFILSNSDKEERERGGGERDKHSDKERHYTLSVDTRMTSRRWILIVL